MLITCPHCKHSFDLSENEVNAIREQIRTAEFEKEVTDRVALASQAAVSKAQLDMQKLAESEREKYRDLEKGLQDEIAKLREQAAASKSEAKLAVKEAEMSCKSEYDKRIADLTLDIRAKEQELQYYKDLKSRMSTKMIGESLEQHCENEFNKIRMMAFPNAEFGKDNMVSDKSGSKGDYIFREYDENGVEIISIMFEMKNEADETASKKKNSAFFKELDKDRNEKNCEYAVLVSLLEADNDYYNTGIVDVSYQYPKMYVIRPQLFITMIGLLRNMALNALSAKQMLADIQNRNLDLSKFESNFEKMKSDVLYSRDQAGKRITEAVAEIDKAIQRLEAAKTAMLSADKHVGQVGKKIELASVESFCSDTSVLKELRKDAEANE